MAVLGCGALMAVNAAVMITSSPFWGGILAVLAFSLIGAGVGAAGTTLLALLASGVARQRRAAAAALADNDGRWNCSICGSCRIAN